MVTISQAISRGLQGTRANLLVLIGAVISWGCFLVMVGVLMGVLFGGTDHPVFVSATSTAERALRWWDMLPIGLILITMGFLTISLLITMGFLTISLKIVRGEKPKSFQAFAGFRKFFPAVGLAFFFVFCSALLNAGTVYLILLTDLPALVEQVEILVWPPVCIFAFLVFFSPWFIADKNMSLKASIRASVKITWEHKLRLFLFFLVLALVVVGILGVFVILRPDRFMPEFIPIGGALGVAFIYFCLLPLCFISTAHMYEGITAKTSKKEVGGYWLGD